LRENSEKLGEDQSNRIERLSALLRKQIGEQITIASSSHTAHRSVVALSISQRVPVQMTYYSSNSDHKSQRLVTAYDFFQENEVEYFQAYCHSSKGMRTFRVDRIVEVSLADVEAEIPSGQVEKNERIRVGATVRSLDRASAEAFRLDFAQLQVGAGVTLEAFSPEWLIRAIMAGAGSLAVDDPAEFRLQIRESVDATIALYE
jgi:proteasome accessory factor C